MIPTPIADRLCDAMRTASPGQKWQAVEDLMIGAHELERQVISGFYEEEIPSYTQGSPTHELQDVVTAEEVTRLVQRLIEARKLLTDLLNGIPEETWSKPIFQAAIEAVAKWPAARKEI